MTTDTNENLTPWSGDLCPCSHGKRGYGALAMDAQTKKKKKKKEKTYCLRERELVRYMKAKSTTALGIEPMSVRMQRQ